MSLMGRVAATAAGVVVSAGLVYTLRPQPMHVDAEPVVRGPLEQEVVDDGRTRVRERYTVSAPVEGTLARIELHEGDVVEPGAVLARLLPLATPLLNPEARKTAQQRLSSAIDSSRQAAATASRAELASDRAARDFARVDALVKEGAVPQADLDQSQADARMREAELLSARFAAKVAEHEIEQARAALERFKPGAAKSDELEVTSPVHGQVLHILHQSEGVVIAGTSLLELGDPVSLELVADVLSPDAVTIRPGMRAQVAHWGGPDLFAKVRLVEPAAFTKTSALGVDEQRVNVILDFDESAHARRDLGDGFAAQIAIITWSAQEVAQVPTSALFRTPARAPVDEGWSVYVVEGGVAKTRLVEIGHRGSLRTEVVRGLSAGEDVIIHPAAAVRDGTRVSFR